MKMTTIREMEEALAMPVYVFRVWTSGFLCDKIWLEGRKDMRRTRYLLTAGQTCTCLGYLKAKKCKHLSMLHDDDDAWVKDGAPADVVAQEAERIADTLKGRKDDLESRFRIDPATLPEIVKVLSIQLPSAANPSKVLSHKTFPQIGDVGIVLVSANFNIKS